VAGDCIRLFGVGGVVGGPVDIGPVLPNLLRDEALVEELLNTPLEILLSFLDAFKDAVGVHWRQGVLVVLAWPDSVSVLWVIPAVR
jgi:hypothetical protein